MTTKTELLELIGAYVDGETDEENAANWGRLSAVIDALFMERDNYLPFDLSKRLMHSVDAVVARAKSNFIARVAIYPAGPGVREEARLFYEYDEARRAADEFAKAKARAAHAANPFLAPALTMGLSLMGLFGLGMLQAKAGPG